MVFHGPIFRAIIEAPFKNLLVGLGFILMVLAILGKWRKTFIIETKWRYAGFAIGSILMILGLSLHMGPFLNPDSENSTPTQDETLAPNPNNFRVDNIYLIDRIRSNRTIPQHLPAPNRTIDPTSLNIRCPALISIEAIIRVTDGSGKVIYQWVRDGIPQNKGEVTFEKEEIKSVYMNETFGEDLNNESHSYKIRILDPNNKVTRTKIYSVSCTNSA